VIPMSSHCRMCLSSSVRLPLHYPISGSNLIGSIGEEDQFGLPRGA
jgi:hypothetical protein